MIRQRVCGQKMRGTRCDAYHSRYMTRDHYSFSQKKNVGNLYSLLSHRDFVLPRSKIFRVIWTLQTRTNIFHPPSL